MVRISDLVRGKSPTPSSAGDGRADSTRLSNLNQLIHSNLQVPPEAPSEKPMVPAHEQSREPEPEQRPQNSPEPPQERRIEEPSSPSPAHLATPDAPQIYLHAQDYLREVKDRLRAGQPLPLEKPLELLEPMIADSSLLDALYQLTLSLGHKKDLDIASPVNCMVYCVKIGGRMGYTPQNLREISLAALHHDIGMFLIPEAILQKEGQLSAAELTLIKKHTEIAKDLTTPYDATYRNVSRAIYEHHERENGKGYPRGLKGDETSEYAKIIGICDSYEAMIHHRPHKKAAAPYLSVLQLAGTKDQLFAPHIMKFFLAEITLYPTGTYVRLNNKAIGVVVQTNPNNPFKPIVRIVKDGQGNRIPNEQLVNLAADNILNIVSGVATDDVIV